MDDQGDSHPPPRLLNYKLTNGQWCTYGTNIFFDMIKVLLLRNSGTWFLYEINGMVLNKLDLRNVWGSANRLTDNNVPT